MADPGQRHRYKNPPPAGVTAKNSYANVAGQLPRNLTYRQVDYWITSYPALFTAGCTQTRTRHFAQSDVEALTVMGRLVDAGLTVQAAAAFAARRTRTGPLSPYVTITVHDMADPSSMP